MDVKWCLLGRGLPAKRTSVFPPLRSRPLLVAERKGGFFRSPAGDKRELSVALFVRMRSRTSQASGRGATSVKTTQRRSGRCPTDAESRQTSGRFCRPPTFPLVPPCARSVALDEQADGRPTVVHQPAIRSRALWLTLGLPTALRSLQRAGGRGGRAGRHVAPRRPALAAAGGVGRPLDAAPLRAAGRRRRRRARPLAARRVGGGGRATRRSAGRPSAARRPAASRRADGGAGRRGRRGERAGGGERGRKAAPSAPEAAQPAARERGGARRVRPTAADLVDAGLELSEDEQE
jgi:hypothetical protein